MVDILGDRLLLLLTAERSVRVSPKRSVRCRKSKAAASPLKRSHYSLGAHPPPIMENTIRSQILRECDKLIRRYHRRIKQQKNDQRRYQQRTGLEPLSPASYISDYWTLSPQFNPFHVRARADAIAHSIEQKLSARTYAPSPALTLQISKPTGGSRGITIFPIPDAAVSNYLFYLLRGRNQHFFSSYAYAYRGDRNSHNAVEHLFRYVKDTNRIYALNYDFSKYFDSIQHDYLRKVLRCYFRISEREFSAVESFLTFRKSNGQEEFQAGTFSTNVRGIPQGSSISLFLANAACLELDLEIEREGAVFARYADDTIILCNTYDMAHRCANRMHAHGQRSETQINFDKSDGIFILTQEPKAEIRSEKCFDFLGNRISQKDITVAAKSLRRIKKKLSGIIHRHLLLYPSRGTFSVNRIGANNLDWDMVTCINEIRRYLYGAISEETLSQALADNLIPLKMNKCLLSYYPLVTNPQAFKDLDGWLINVIMRAQKRRRSLITQFIPNYSVFSREDLINGGWYQHEIPNETRLPSFFRGWLYVRKLLKIFGASKFPVPDYQS